MENGNTVQREGGPGVSYEVRGEILQSQWDLQDPSWGKQGEILRKVIIFSNQGDTDNLIKQSRRGQGVGHGGDAGGGWRRKLHCTIQGSIKHNLKFSRKYNKANFVNFLVI